MITPPGVARAIEYPLDATQGPCGQLLRQDGSVVCWGSLGGPGSGHQGIDVWDLNALGRHEDEPARGHGYRPYEPPPSTGPETWPEPRDLVPPPPKPIDQGEQLDFFNIDSDGSA